MASFIYLNHHTPSVQYRVYRVAQLLTDGVRCGEFAGIGPVNLEVVPNGCCLGRSPWSSYYAPLFPTPTIGMKWACWKYCYEAQTPASVEFDLGPKRIHEKEEDCGSRG